MLRGRTIANDSNFFARLLGGASRYWAVFVVAAAVGIISVAQAATVTHTDDDAPAGNNNTPPEEHSFDGAFHWSDSGSPTAGNDYINQSFLIRTNTVAGNYTFAGDSLTLQDGGQLRLRNAVATDNITVNNLIIDGGNVRSNSSGGVGSNLAGTIKVTANGATFTQFNSSNLFLNLTANISDASGSPGGALSFGGNDFYNGPATNKRVTLAPATANTWTGPTNLLGGNLQVGSASALPTGTTLYFGSGMTIPNSTSTNGGSTLDLNGQSISLAGIAVQSYTASSALLTGTQPSGGTLAAPANTHSRIIRVAPIAPGTVKVGQLVTAMFSSGGNTPARTTSMVTDIYNDPGNLFTDITLGDNSQLTNAAANLNGLSFGAGLLAGGQPIASAQVIGNGSTTSDATLTITGSSTFDGNIVDTVVGNPNGGGAGNRKTNLAFTANGGTLTLRGANSYTGTTTLSGSGSTLALNYASNVAYPGIISGIGSVSKGRTGTLTLTGVNSYNGGAGNTANIYSGNTIVDGGTLAVEFTTGTSTGLTWTASTSLINPSTISLANIANGTGLVFTANAPTGTAINTPYFVVNSNGTTIQIATSPGGLPIALGNSGTTLALSRYDRASNIINSTANSSALVLTGGTLQVRGGGAQANSQQFNGLSLSFPSGITLTTNAVTNTPAQAVALNVGAITRSQGGVLALTNPSGTLSATNGLQTTTGSASSIIATAGGTPYVVVGSNDWGAKDATNAFVVGGSTIGGFYTANGATTLSGNADIVGTDTTLASGGSATSIRFNDFAASRQISISGGTLITGGVLVTNGANASAFNQTITGGTLQAAGAGGDLVLVENNTQGSLSITSAISDNGGSGLATAGPGTIKLSGANSYTGKTSIGGGTLNIPVKQAFYGGTVSAASAGKVTVNTGATLGLNVGGAGEFTAGDVGTLLTNATFKYASTLALDTTNAGAGTATVNLPGVVTDTGAGANQFALTKNGINDLTLFGGNNTYSGPTTINKGFVRLASGGSLSGGSVVTMANDASTGLDLNGGTATLRGLSGGATAGGSTVALGAGGTLNLVSTTISATQTLNANFTGSGAINVNVPNVGTAPAQIFNGAGTTGLSELNLINGQLTLQAGSATTWGASTTLTSIATVPSASGTTTLTIGANTKLVSSLIMVGGDVHGDAATTNDPFFPAYNAGSATLNINQANSGTTSSLVANTLFIGAQGAPQGGVTSTVNIGAGGTTPVNPTVELRGTLFSAWGNNNGNNAGTLVSNPNPNVVGANNVGLALGTSNNTGGTLNIAGTTTALKMENSSTIVFGRYFGRTNTINQSGGTVTFYSDLGTTVGGTGGVYFDNDNSGGGNAGTYRYNLTGGTLTTPVVYNAGCVSNNPTTNNPNGPMLLLNGGTLGATADSLDFITGQANPGFNGSGQYLCPPIVRIGSSGGSIDVNGHSVTITAGIFHDPNIAAGTPDGGLTVKSTGGNGTLILMPTNQNAAQTDISGTQHVIDTNTYTSYTGPTTIQSGATLKPSVNAAVKASSGFVVNGKYDVSSLSNPHLVGTQTLSGNGGLITAQFQHQTPTAEISPGVGSVPSTARPGEGTIGTLTFDTYLELTGGKARFDLSNDAVAGANDQVIVTAPGQSFAAQASPSTSVIQCEFTDVNGPSSNQVYQLVKFPNGSFFGSTTSVLFNGTNYDTPTGLTLASAGNKINGRDAILAVNSTTHSLDLVFHSPVVLTGDLIWTGASSTAWDTNSSANWNNQATSTNPDKFFSGDKVTFDNSPAVPHTVFLTGGGLAPSSVTVNSSAGNNFTFDSSTGGKISGPGTLTKNGTSTLTIKEANDYTGGTTISQGTVVCIDPGSGTFNSALGVGDISIAAGAVLQVGNGTSGLGTIAAVTATSITNNGSINFNRPDAFTMFGNMTGPGTFSITGGGTITLGTAASTSTTTPAYSGNTTITGATLAAGIAGAFSPNSVYHLSNVAGSTLNTGGFNVSVGGLADGGATGGSVTSPNGGTLTIAGNATNTFAGTISLGTTGLTVNGALTGGLTNLVQNLTGSSVAYTGQTVVSNGTLNINPSAASSIGATNLSVNVANANFNNGTLMIGANATVAANNLNVGQGGGRYSGNPPALTGNAPGTNNPGGNGSVTISGTLNVNGALNFGNSLGNATVNLAGGTMTIAGGTAMNFETNVGQNQFNRGSVDVGGNTHAQSDFELGYTGGTLNVSGNAHLYMVNANAQSIQFGQFFNGDGTINQNGGTVSFVTDGTFATSNDLGRLLFLNNNAGNFGTYTYNLNGGVFTVGQIGVDVSSFGAATGEVNNRPAVNFNGGTLRVASGSSTNPATFFNRDPVTDGNGNGTPLVAGAGSVQPILTVVKVGGGTIDTNGRAGVGMDAAFAHDPALGGFGLDGGLNFNDSAASTGDVTLTGAGGTFNGGAIITRGKVIAGADAILAHSVAATGTTSSQVVTVPTSTALSVGEAVTGPGVPDGTVIAAFTTLGIAPVANGSTPGAIRYANITLGAPAAGSNLINVVLSNATTIANGAGASLTFGATSPLGTELVMNGGTFASSAANRDLSAATSLKTTANSTIDLAGGTLRMADSALTHWANNSVLTIANPTGGHLFVGSGQTLNPNQLKNITFAGSPQGAVQLATGEVVPGPATGFSELLGNVDHNSATDAGDIGALANALSNVTIYTNNLTLDPGWSSKAAEALYLADVKNDDRINNLDVQGLIVYLANGGNGSNAPGGGSLTAVPEPSTLALLVIGGVILGGVARGGICRRGNKN
jgi:fibronectin-binding autotransporter adhesin